MLGLVSREDSLINCVFFVHLSDNLGPEGGIHSTVFVASSGETESAIQSQLNSTAA